MQNLEHFIIHIHVHIHITLLFPKDTWVYGHLQLQRTKTDNIVWIQNIHET